MRGITRDTVSQMIDRKGTLTAALLMVAGVIAVYTSDWRQLHITFGDTATGESSAGLAEIALHFLSTYMNLLVGLFVVLAAGIFPALLSPDRTWFYFSRPLSREKIVIEKLVAVLAVYLGLLCVTVLAVVAAGMVRYELFDIRIGRIILIHLFNGGIWLVLVSSLGLLFRSTLKVVLAGVSVWLVQLVLLNRESVLKAVDLSILAPLFDTLNYAFPKTVELGNAAHLIAAGQQPDLILPIITTLLFASVLLSCGLFAVRRRDL
jgi:ABC-type transport system involved in multi-copper enzyme maturation permease subunit